MAGASLLATRAHAARTAGSEFPYAEFEARIASRDFRDITKDILPTPCMVVDLDLFEKNMQTMVDQAKGAGIYVRPHVKIHKSVDVAKRQVAQGAIGVTTATIAESELMSNAGIKGVLWTKQPASVNNIQRAVALSKKDPTFMFVADDPQVVEWVEEAAAARNTKARIAVSVFAEHDAAGHRWREAGGRSGAEGRGVEADVVRGLHGVLGRRRAHQGLGGAAQAIGRRPRPRARIGRAGAQVRTAGGHRQRRIDRDVQHRSRARAHRARSGSYVFMDTGYITIGSKSGEACTPTSRTRSPC